MTDFKSMMPEVARRLWGQENTKLSSRNELRWGNAGARKVTLEGKEAGTWYDHSDSEGGGVLDLIRREMSTDNKGAIDWLKENGFEIEDRQQEQRPQQRAPLPQHPNEQQRNKITATFDYFDENLQLVYQVCRLEDGTRNPDTGKLNKTFRQRRPDGEGWSWSVKGLRPLIYRLPEVMAAVADDKPIFIVEGEKAVHAMEAYGYVATCNSGGAGKWPDEMSEHLKGADVFILPDNDEAGENHCNVVASSLVGIAASVSVIRLPDLPEKGDIADWQGSNVDLENLIATAEDWRPAPPTSRFGAVQYKDIYNGQKSDAEWLIKDTVNANGMCVLAGPPQSGKSFIALEMAMAVAHGTDYNGKRVEKGAVVYQAGEGQRGFHKRVEAYREHFGREDVPFVLLQEPINLFGDESTVVDFIGEVLAWEAFYGEKVRMLVIDTFSAATPGVNENASDHVTTVLARLQRIQKECDCTVLVLHHMNADGSRVRGHSSLQGNVDNVLICRKLEITDRDNRIVRTVTIDKNKDGEAGGIRRFVLKRVVIGVDAEGDEISSCIVGSPNKGEEQQVGRMRLSAREVILKDALLVAQETYPMPVKPEYGEGLTSCTTYRSWQQEALKRWPYTHDMEGTTEDNELRLITEVKAAMKRFGEKMRAAHKLGIFNEGGKSIVWWAGGAAKPVKPREETNEHKAAVGDGETKARDEGEQLPF